MSVFKKGAPSLILVRWLFTYDRLSGELRWAVPRGKKIKVGDLIRSRCVRIDGTEYRTSRVCWFTATGHWPDEIDHQDLDEQNNKFLNMRECTHAQNLLNSRVCKHNKLGVKGVHIHQGRFRARIALNGVVRRQMFASLDEAAAAYAAWSLELHGEFGRV